MDRIDREERKQLTGDLGNLFTTTAIALVDGKISKDEGDRIQAALVKFGKDFAAAVAKQDGHQG